MQESCQNKILDSFLLSATILSHQKRETKMLKNFKVTVRKWDNEVDGVKHDLSHLRKKYRFQLEVEDEDSYNEHDMAMNYVTESTGWCIEDCEVLVEDC